MIEITVLKTFLTKSEYLMYHKYLSKLELEHEIKTLLSILGDYYDEFPQVDGLTVDEFEVYFALKNPADRSKATYNELFVKLRDLSVTEDTQQSCIKRMVEKYYAAEIVGELTDVLYGASYDKLEEVGETVEDFLALMQSVEEDEEESDFVEASAEAIRQVVANPNGLHWRLSKLEEYFGPIAGGILGHVFACTGVGKTSFLASELTHMATQIEDDEIILWMNNEEQGEKVQGRLYNAVLQTSTKEYLRHPQKADEEFINRGGLKVRVVDKPSIHVSDIRRFLKKYKVRLLVIDVADKVHFKGEERVKSEHLRLGKLYEILRTIAKEFRIPIITTGQAAVTDRERLTIEDMSESKVGKPKELDFALGIGEPKDENLREVLRYLSIAKTKMAEGRRGSFGVRFDQEKALFSDVA